VLRSDPTHVLECGPADVSRIEHDVDRATLRVVLRENRGSEPRSSLVETRVGVVAIPKFTYHFSARKLRNFGHWVLDCLPQVVALRALAPEAVFLLPRALKGFHRRTLALLGVGEERIVAWDGEAVSADRVLILEGDGRVGGGRPLASLVALRDTLAPVEAAEGRRRIYVSRRDAKPHRRWVDNEPAIEALFEERGFEILCMAECPLEEQVAHFRDAQIVAGVSGAGLTDLLFAPAHAHVIVLVTDGLMRWYADEGQSRALWLDGTGGGELSALGDSPRFYGHVAAAFGQTSHTFIGGDHLPLEPLARFVDEVLARLETV
jgi:capsular polysaccharide biosynthesis protein